MARYHTNGTGVKTTRIPISIGGDAFIGLLRMTVLLYIVLLLLVNLGRLSPTEAADSWRSASPSSPSSTWSRS